MSFSFILWRHVTYAGLKISLSEPNSQVLRLQACVILSSQCSLLMCAEIYTKFKIYKLDVHINFTYHHCPLRHPQD